MIEFLASNIYVRGFMHLLLIVFSQLLELIREEIKKRGKMQDRLKFRMFNKPVKKFSYFSLPELQVCLNRDFKSGLIFPMDESIEDNAIYMGEYEEIQFSTGLKDKNGKLIFEGDIVDCYVSSKKIYRYQIKQEIGSFMLVSPKEEIFDFINKWNDNVYPLSQLYFEYENEENCIEQCEIIGNIYMDSHLLGISNNL